MEQEIDGSVDTDDSPPDEVGAEEKKFEPHPNSLANLKPPWLPGQSGNPSGLTKDGKPTRSLTTALEKRLERRGGLKWIAEKLLTQFARGNSKAIESVLARLDPLDQAQGRQILEGLSLELTSPDGTRASLKAMRGSGQLPAAGERDDAVEQEGEGPGGIDHQVTPGPGDTRAS